MLEEAIDADYRKKAKGSGEVPPALGSHFWVFSNAD